MVEYFCEKCNGSFARKDSLSRHHLQKYPCDGVKSEDIQIFSPMKSDRVPNKHFASIPCFDGNEFIEGKPKSKETLYKMMKMLRVPENNWDRIANEMMT